MEKRVQAITDYLRKKIKNVPEIAIISSREIKNYIAKIKDPIEVNYVDIPNFPFEGSDKHGKFIFGYVGKKYIMVMFGRLHLYNNYKQGETIIPLFVIKELGSKSLIITGSVGAINPRLKIGYLVNIKDHINLTGRNPLNETMLDTRVKFFDLSSAYDKELGLLAKQVGKQQFKFKVPDCTIVQYPGPTPETPAEIRLAKLADADVAGFNFVYDAIVSSYCGIRCLAIGVITNYAAPYSKNQLKYEDVKYNLQCSDEYFSDYLIEVIKKM